MISASAVKDLREKTGCGMMDCKKALTHAEGDMEKAVEYLREKGLATAAKKSGRIAAEGIVNAYTDGSVGALLEVNAETDFVAKNAEFMAFVNNLSEQIVKNRPENVETLCDQAYIADPKKTVKEALNEKIATIGENMNIRRFAIFEGEIETYIHGGGRIGVMVQFEVDGDSDSEQLALFKKDIAMQVAAVTPLYVNISDVPEEVINKEREILRAQALNEGKPEKIVDKMVEGRINKYYKEVCLTEQPFIKDQDKSVSQYVSETSKALGCEIKIVNFVRFEKGEGIEKRSDDFANEVSSMLK